MISNEALIMQILDTVEHFCQIDQELGYSGKGTLLYQIETAQGLDLLEEL